MAIERILNVTPDNKLFDLDHVPFAPYTTTLVTGYWDLTHYAHAQFLRKCREIGDPLVVGVITENFSTKPGGLILHDFERAMMVRELESVDWVFLDKKGYNGDMLRKLNPKNIVFSDGEENNHIKNGQITFLKDNFPDTNVITIPRQSNHISTSEILRRIRCSQIAEGEVLLPENINKELIRYSEASNAAMKTSSFILTDTNVVVSKGYNYHPIITEEPLYLNTNTHEYLERKPRPMHAEMDAILKLYQRGITDFSKLILHSLVMPCANCAEVIIRTGLQKVIYYQDFDNNFGELILKKANIALIKAN